MAIVFGYFIGSYLLWVYTWGIGMAARAPSQKADLPWFLRHCPLSIVNFLYGALLQGNSVIHLGWAVVIKGDIPAPSFSRATAGDTILLAYYLLIYTAAITAALLSPVHPEAIATMSMMRGRRYTQAILLVCCNIGLGAAVGAFAPLILLVAVCDYCVTKMRQGQSPEPSVRATAISALASLPPRPDAVAESEYKCLICLDDVWLPARTRNSPRVYCHGCLLSVIATGEGRDPLAPGRPVGAIDVLPVGD